MATEATTLREMATRFEGYAQMWRCQGRDEDAAAMDQAAALYHRKASELEASAFLSLVEMGLLAERRRPPGKYRSRTGQQSESRASKRTFNRRRSREPERD